MIELPGPFNSLASLEQWTSPAGGSVAIRPIRSADLDLEREFVNSLSTATGYQRLLSQRRLSEDELRRFTDIDYEHEFALIATTPLPSEHESEHQPERERQVGVARYIREETPGHAEFSIVLSDDWQGRGLGYKLLNKLIEAARRSGISRVNGSTLTENAAMIALARKLGFTTQIDPRGAYIMLLTLQLEGRA
jgi:RimJ/RimL family protein N-acetyltransferase